MRMILNPACFIFFLAYISGCKDIPPIALRTDKVEGSKYSSQGRPILDVTLSSEEDLVKIYKEEKGSNIYIFCPLQTSDFSIENISAGEDQLYGYNHGPDSSVRLNNRYINKFTLRFIDKDFNWLDINKIQELIKNRKCIDCKLVIAFFLFKKNFLSNTFCIPVDSITKYINH